MNWKKKKLIFCPDNHPDFKYKYAQAPFADFVDQNKLRIYFSSRDKKNRSLPFYIETEAENPENILYIHHEPILKLGNLGSFDDSGVMPSCIVNYNNKKYLYYVGWNVGTTARYRLAHGLAISNDNGQTFKKYSEGPILDRSTTDPYSVSNQSIIIEKNVWRMWSMAAYLLPGGPRLTEG